MPDFASFVLLSLGVFAGAVVSGFAGFAFSAVAGAILLHLLPPTEAVPLMMACSLVVQSATLIAIRRSIQWRASLTFILGGALGVLPALYLLHQVDARTFRIGFGVFLACYAAYMLVRPAIRFVPDAPGRFWKALVGFGGGFVGGLTAMPGAIMVIWCDLRGMSKEEQRGLAQPFIFAMQVFALGLLLARGGFSTKGVMDLTLSLPALAAGAALGIALFGRVNETVFRRSVLAILFVAGIGLAM